MRSFRTVRVASFRAAVATLTVVAMSLAAVPAQDPMLDWHPESDYQGEFDWVQMTSGEWLKGEIVVMYDEELEFESDEFDTLMLDWDDIQQIRSSQVVNVGLLEHRSATGRLIVDGDRVTVLGDEVSEFTRGEVLSLTVGIPKEINFWSAKLFFGLIVRSGNSDIRETNVHANVKRRTIRDRVSIDIIGNQNVTDGLKIADNQRASAGWDRFVSDRFFVQPFFGEYFRDPFQNIGRRITLGVGVGYQLIDSAKVQWSLSGGPAYQNTRFDSVESGEDEDNGTAALVIATEASWDITRWLEFDGLYRAQFVSQEAGTYNHHLVVSLETEITSFVDFDIGWIWDRIQDPPPSADGSVVATNDFRTTVGVTFEF